MYLLRSIPYAQNRDSIDGGNFKIAVENKQVESGNITNIYTRRGKFYFNVSLRFPRR